MKLPATKDVVGLITPETFDPDMRKSDIAGSPEGPLALLIDTQSDFALSSLLYQCTRQRGPSSLHFLGRP